MVIGLVMVSVMMLGYHLGSSHRVITTPTAKRVPHPDGVVKQLEQEHAITLHAAEKATVMMNAGEVDMIDTVLAKKPTTHQKPPLSSMPSRASSTLTAVTTARADIPGPASVAGISAGVRPTVLPAASNSPRSAKVPATVPATMPARLAPVTQANPQVDGQLVVFNPAGFTLFVSLAPFSPHFGEHYAELMAAIRANLMTGAFEEVVVWYESTPQSTCTRLINSLLYGDPEMSARIFHARLRCWDRSGGQPTYGDIFRKLQAAVPLLHTQGVVVANADVVFGPTLHSLRPISAREIHTLTVNGASAHVPALYCAAMGQGLETCRPCNTTEPDQPTSCHIADRQLQSYTVSWDGYAFNTTSFSSLTITADMMPFMMNGIGDENKAVCELLKHGWLPSNNCMTVRTIHFHCAKKTHLAGEHHLTKHEQHQAKVAAKQAGLWHPGPSPPKPPPCKSGLFYNTFFHLHEQYLNYTPVWLHNVSAAGIL